MLSGGDAMAKALGVPFLQSGSCRLRISNSLGVLAWFSLSSNSGNSRKHASSPGYAMGLAAMAAFIVA